MIIILGASAAGKSTIEKALGLKRIISYTTRPIRPNEMDGIDYHFIPLYEFERRKEYKFFAESTNYNGWKYGIAKDDCHDDSIVVVEPYGFRQLKKNKDLNITSFFIKVDERDRVVRMMKRGDNVMESFRRIISDQGSFNGIEGEVDYVIENKDGELNWAIDQIISIIFGEKENL